MFLPIVQKAMARVKLESYITRKALDGLYVSIAEEEALIRANPVQETSNIVRKVFGVLGK